MQDTIYGMNPISSNYILFFLLWYRVPSLSASEMILEEEDCWSYQSLWKRPWEPYEAWGLMIQVKWCSHCFPNYPDISPISNLQAGPIAMEERKNTTSKPGSPDVWSKIRSRRTWSNRYPRTDSPYIKSWAVDFVCCAACSHFMFFSNEDTRGYK